MLQNLAGTIPSVVVGVAFLAILFSLLRREMRNKSADTRQEEQANHRGQDDS